MMVAEVMLLPFSHGARTRDGFVSFNTLKILILDSKRANAKPSRGVLSTLGVRHITSQAHTTEGRDAAVPQGARVPDIERAPQKAGRTRRDAAQNHAAADRSAYGAESEW